MSDFIDPNGAADLEDDDLGSLTQEKGNFEQVPHALWHSAYLDGRHNVSPQAVVAYLALSRRSGSAAVPKRKTLADDMGCSVRTVDGRLDELVKKGWLLITPRFRKDGPGVDARQTSNHYHLLFEPIQSEADSRFQAYLRRVTAFEFEMSAKQESNRRRLAREGVVEEAEKRGRDSRSLTLLPPVQDSARGPVQDSARGVPSKKLHGALAESCTGPSQDPARQDKDFLGGIPLGSNTPSVPSGEGDDETPALDLVLADASPAPKVPTFEEFYAAYPKKADKATAKRTWEKWVKKGITPERIMAGLADLLADPNLPTGDEVRYIKNASTWLNAEGWDHEPLAPRRGGQTVRVAYDDDATWGDAAARQAELDASNGKTEEEILAEVLADFERAGKSQNNPAQQRRATGGW